MEPSNAGEQIYECEAHAPNLAGVTDNFRPDAL